MVGVSWNRSNLFISVFLYLTTFVSAQTLSFTGPDLTPVSSGSGLPYFTEGQYVTISWTTPFSDTNLFVYQQKDSAYKYVILSLRSPKNLTSFVWRAGAVDGLPLTIDHPFHFVIENSDSLSCQGCVKVGDDFNVRSASSAPSSTSSSVASSSTAAAAPATQRTTTRQHTRTHRTHTTSPTPASQTSQAQQTSSTPAAAGAAGSQDQSSATPSPSDSGSHNDLGIGLGVGLGLGIPLLLALLGLCFFCVRRRRKQKRRFSYRPTGSGNWTADEPMMEHRESGALGPWAAQSRTSGLSQQSHSSWIEPFPFEKPGSRDQDAMSQLRRSIHSSGSSYSQKADEAAAVEAPAKAKHSRTSSATLVRNSEDDDMNTKYAWMGGSASPTKASNGWGAGTAAARRSDVSWANTDMSSLEGIPEQLQPVHHRYSNLNGRNGYTSGHNGYTNGGYANGGYTNAGRGDGRDWPLP